MKHNNHNTLKNIEPPMPPGLYLQDCMDAMKLFPDGFFDLAIVDQPYGDGKGGSGADRFGGMFGASIDGTATRNTPHHHGITVSAERSTNTNENPKYSRFGGRFDRYKTPFRTTPAAPKRPWSAGAANGPQSTAAK